MTLVITPLADVRPAELVTPVGRQRGLRVFVWPDLIRAWGLVAGQPELLWEAGVASIDRGRAPATPGRDNPWLVTTTGGDVWTLTRGSGCGCGSPLLRLRPEREEAPA